MKILHIYDHTEPLQSGYVFRSRTLRNALSEDGHECHVLSMPRHYASGNGQTYTSDTQEISGQIYYRTKPYRFRIPFISDFLEVIRSAFFIAKLHKKNRYDVIHAHSPIFCGLAVLLAIKLTKSLDVLSVYEIRAFWEDAAVDHGSISKNSFKYRLIQNIETWICQKIDRVYPICEQLKQDLITRGISPEKITVIPNVVTENSFKQTIIPENIQALKQKYKLDETDYILGFIGSFYAYEGLEDLLPIISKIKEKGFPIKLLLVGGGPANNILKSYVKKHHLDKEVIFTGRIEHSTVFDHYQLCTAMIYPRRSMRLTETVTPLKPLEAVAAGIPVILSDIGGHRELLENDVTGFFIPDFKDIAKSAVQIQEILVDPDKRATIASTAYSHIKETRLPKDIVKKYYQ